MCFHRIFHFSFSSFLLAIRGWKFVETIIRLLRIYEILSFERRMSGESWRGGRSFEGMEEGEKGEGEVGSVSFASHVALRYWNGPRQLLVTWLSYIHNTFYTRRRPHSMWKKRERERKRKKKKEGRKEGKRRRRGGYDRHWLVVVGERSCTLFLAFHPGFVPLGFYTTAIHHTIASFAFYCRTIRPTYVKCTVFCATYCLFRSNLYSFFLSR